MVSILGKNKKQPVPKSAQEKIAHLQSVYGTLPCSELKLRTVNKVIGEVQTIRIAPRGQGHWLEVVISDGTEKVNGWFFGRKSIAGMQFGSIVMFEGLVQMDEGELTIANPYYEFL